MCEGEVQGEGLEISLDLADLRGFQYHSGVMFSAYVDNLPSPCATFAFPQSQDLSHLVLSCIKSRIVTIA